MSALPTPNAIKSLVFEAVTRTNEELETEMQIEARGDEVLIGPGAKLDSLAFVSLILEIEALVDAQLGITLELVNDRALSQEHSPFRTLGTLVAYVEGSIAQPDADV
jgi:acyl carrier protein